MFLLVWMAGRYDETRDLCLAVSFGSSVASAARVIQSVYNLGAANANDNLANGRQSREKGAVVIEMTAAEFRGRQQGNGPLGLMTSSHAREVSQKIGLPSMGWLAQ